MPRSEPLTFAHFVTGPENRAGWRAVRRVAESLGARRPNGTLNPLYLHGPPGTGKTHLVTALVAEVTRERPDGVATVLAALDLISPAAPPEEKAETIRAARASNLVVIEDVQFLGERAAEVLGRLVEDLQRRQVQVVLTASVGPGSLELPARVRSRLASGLVVGLEPPAAPSRRALLEAKVAERRLAVGRDVLAWLAERLTGGGRQLEGALNCLETLAQGRSQPLDLAAVAGHFPDETRAERPTMERIAQQVGGHFRVAPAQLQSGRRARDVLLPRQVGMYLARQLTGLSLEQIGAYFGGRDHSTVLHACRKVERELSRDPALSGTVRRLRSDLR